MLREPHILLVNPWITDFAAYDLWAKPLGLLQLGSLLREGGCQVSFADCLNRHDPDTASHSEVLPGVDRQYGTGKYPRIPLPSPSAYGEFPRYYYRYGIHPQSLRNFVNSLPGPDLIWVTSIMTHWYPGVQQTIADLRTLFPEIPIWLGGIYARLCYQHAQQHSGADLVVTGPSANIPAKVKASTGFTLRNLHQWHRFDAHPRPALDLIPDFKYAPILGSLGCPYRCPYCASYALAPDREQRTAASLYQEIVYWHQQHGIVDFAFYDDALLVGAESTIRPVLERICQESLGVRFHTPNALHIRALTTEWCELLKESGFTTLRLGLETIQPHHQKEWGDKIEVQMFPEAMANLKAAGFASSQIGVYLLCGLPGQSPEDVEASIDAVRKAGGQPYLAEYSPLPGTAMWSHVTKTCPYDLEAEPLYHNNSFFACRRPDFTYEDLLHLKELARQARRPNSLTSVGS